MIAAGVQVSSTDRAADLDAGDGCRSRIPAHAMPGLRSIPLRSTAIQAQKRATGRSSARRPGLLLQRIGEDLQGMSRNGLGIRFRGRCHVRFMHSDGFERPIDKGNVHDELCV